MSTSPAPASHFRRVGPWAIPALVALAYAGAHLAWYRHTPLGQVPVLDEQENLVFAENIARGAVPHEPFYRAPGYALMLAAVRVCGVPIDRLFGAALMLGVVLHAVSATLAALITRTLFAAPAALAAGLLCALNPVFVHYATQALDGTAGLFFFLLGLWLVVPELVRTPAIPPSWCRWVGASTAWAAATVTRPNYLLVWCALPVLAAWLARGGRTRAIIGSMAGAVVFVAIAGWQSRVSDVAGFLPWQGPYNLWAANQPGVHGRVYIQRHKLPASVGDMNPARAESIYYYRQEVGRAPDDITALNRHWRGRFLDHIRQHPVVWLGLLTRKSYALLNNWEQYNNKTYAFHRDRSPWLRWNPICWGLLFVAGIAGFSRLATEHVRAAAALAIVVGLTALSILLFFVSARFRLPLAAVAAILAGGALGAPRFWQRWPRPRQIALAAGTAVAALISFSAFDGVRSRATFVEDHALLARAAMTTGEYAEAWTAASAALELQPVHADAMRIAVSSYFNQLVQAGPLSAAEEARWTEICTRFLSVLDREVIPLRAIAALALWREGKTSEAQSEWRRLGPLPAAVAARLMSLDITVTPADLANAPPGSWNDPLVRLAALRFRITPPAGVSLGNPDKAVEVSYRLFGQPSFPTPR
ncbi:MAG TPA: hypothetical protein VM029_11795 [Opitutaceae bacterium]|nr:hypothetical protein [Opitutaceae bacterium]